MPEGRVQISDAGVGKKTRNSISSRASARADAISNADFIGGPLMFDP